MLNVNVTDSDHELRINRIVDNNDPVTVYRLAACIARCSTSPATGLFALILSTGAHL